MTLSGVRTRAAFHQAECRAVKSVEHVLGVLFGVNTPVMTGLPQERRSQLIPAIVV